MGLTKLEGDTIDKGIKLARKILTEIEPIMRELEVVYADNDMVTKTVTQDNLDMESRYSGLKKDALDAGMGAMLGVIKTAISDNYKTLQLIASRAQ